MIILDTNVLSALMQSTPEAIVVDWLNRQPAESIWITTITVYEIRFGLALMPQGRKRRSLELSFDRLLDEDFENRVLDYDVPSATAAALLAADRHRAGKTPDIRDTQIAGIVLARRAVLATRNVRHFSDLAATVVNPWTS